LDAGRRLVESDNGRALTLALVGGGSLGQATLETSAGTASTNYTAPPIGGQATVTAASDGLSDGAITFVTEAVELERLRAEARGYLHRLRNLTWDSYDKSLPLSRSLNMDKAQSLVDDAVPGDEQRLRRLNMFLRVLDRSWY